VTRSVSLPLSEIELRVSRSSGPGGQHAQKSSTRVEAIFEVESSEALSEVQKRRVLAKAGPVIAALAVPRRRVPTSPGPQARERRLEEKRRRARTKALRRAPDAD